MNRLAQEILINPTVRNDNEALKKQSLEQSAMLPWDN